MQNDPVQYAGFWIRVGAFIIDSLLIMMVIIPLLLAIYGRTYFDSVQAGLVAGPADFLLSWVAPAVAVVAFWIYMQATPGKRLLSMRIVDAQTLQPASPGKLVIRYLGYYVSMIPFMLGLIWVGLDAKKQGWHDKLAGTVVIMSKGQA
jgi:uncharacterized RDD family membrane protein YckC